MNIWSGMKIWIKYSRVAETGIKELFIYLFISDSDNLGPGHMATAT